VLQIDAPSTIRSLTMPVLVMHGDADTVVPPAHAQIICASVAGPCTVEIFEGVGHRFEEPGALARLLDVLAAWLDRHKDG
jgi:pimeloyl-ACP methyl ester carboxylesterase